MRGKLILGVLLGVIFFSLVASLTNFEINQISCSTFEEGKANIIGMKIPEKIPYKNEIFNIYIGEQTFGNIVIIESIISDFSCIEHENRTYDVYIKDYSVLTNFGEVADPVSIFQEKLKNKEIEIKGVGFGKKTKMFFTKVGLKIFSWFN